MGNVLFEVRFQRLISMWGSDSFPEVYREMAVKRTNDLSAQELIAMVDALLEQSERTPSLSKLVGFAAMVRARRPIPANTQFTGANRCRECDDIGVVRTKHEKLGDLIMRCENKRCTPSYYWPLPRWSSEYEKTFKKSKCPVEWFKPKSGDLQNERAADWLRFIKLANSKFLDAGFSCEETFGGCMVYA